MMACHAPTATCTTTFSSRRLFNFLFIFIFCLVSLFGVVDAARGGVTRPCSSFSSLQNNKEKGDFFESIHCRPDDRRSGIVPRFFFFFFFHSSDEWREQKKKKEIRSEKMVKWPPPKSVLQFEGTTLLRAGLLYEVSFLVAPSSSFIQAAQFSVLYVCAVVVALLYGWFPMH